MFQSAQALIGLALGLPLVGVGLIVLHGYGTAALFLSRASVGSWPATAAIGMGGLSFLGGLCNLFGVAYPATLIVLIAIGIAIDVLWWVKGGFNQCRAAIGHYGIASALLVALAIAVVVGFAAATQFAPAVFNVQDDLEKYFAFPLRMLATGTLGGDPLNALGSETLGQQAFLQAFICLFLPINYINGFDAVLCLALAAMLAASFVGAPVRLAPLGFLAVAVLLSVHPQYVNVSSLYSGAALMMGVVACADERSRRVGRTSLADCVPMGLMLAVLIGIKPVYFVFAASFLLVLACGDTIEESIGTAAKRFALRMLAVGFFLAPWLALYALDFVQAVGDTPPSLTPATPVYDLFSSERLISGGSYLLYSGTALGIALLASLPLLAWRKMSSQQRRRAIALWAGGAAAAISYFAIMLELSRWHSDPLTVLRYALVGLVAMAPLTLGGWQSVPRPTRGGRPAAILTAVAFAISIVISFLPATGVRVAQALEQGNVLAFSWLATRQDYVAYNAQTMSVEQRDRMRMAQSLVPIGEPILVWTSSPFHLDYERNRLYDVQPAALATPWAHVPPAKFVIWEYRGFAVRSPTRYRREMREQGAYEKLIATRGLGLMLALYDASQSNRLLYNDGSLLVMELTQPISDDWRNASPK
jgi:hypothetical protein